MANDRLLIKYLPPFMQEYIEIQAIMNTEQLDIDALWTAIKNAFDDQYIMDATEYGVMRWESMLKISPKPTETLDERKFRILAYLNRKLPYTMTRLKELLTVLCGVDGFIIDLRAEHYYINIKLGVGNHNKFEEVKKLLNTVLPANLTQEVTLLYNPHRVLGLFRHCDLAKYNNGDLRKKVIEVYA